MQVHDFEFNKVTNEVVDKIVNKINIKKATGADGIPATIVNFVLNISFKTQQWYQSHLTICHQILTRLNGTKKLPYQKGILTQSIYSVPTLFLD
jgi:hypothetical protein